jgi:DNA (cytosine-5)-methyltransferase 1
MSEWYAINHEGDAMKIGSLFAGIGGFDIGVSAVFPNSQVLWQCEKDTYCQSILRRYWPSSTLYDDITTIDATKLQAIDLLLCGFPCQDLSIANAHNKGNIHSPKSGLYWHAYSIIKTIRPKYIIFENVSAITFRNKGGMEVLRSLAAIGYDAWWDCIQAREMGAPHIRDRWFCICIRQDDTPDTDMCSIEEHPIRTEQVEEEHMSECESGKDAGLYTADYWKGCEAPSPFCRVDDGIQNRIPKIRALGNSIVPQVAAFVAQKLHQLIQEQEQ